MRKWPSFFSVITLYWAFTWCKNFMKQYFLCQFPLNFFDFFLWLNISFTIHFNHDEERCRAHFSKYCKSYFPTTPINSFKYIMSEATVPSFASYSCLEHFQKYRRKSSYVSNELRWNFTFNWIFCVYSFRLIISLGIKTANW